MRQSMLFQVYSTCEEVSLSDQNLFPSTTGSALRVPTEESLALLPNPCSLYGLQLALCFSPFWLHL